MAKKTGLGKGLDALFSSPIMEEKVESEEVVEQVKYLKINEIEPNKEQARKIFDEEAIEELSNSIKEYGGVKFVGLGKIFVKECKERIGRNPKNGNSTVIPKHKTVKFQVGEMFKDSLNV